MKTKFKITLALLVLIQGGVLGQQRRYCDTKINIISPDSGTLVMSPSSLSFSFSLINKGPDIMFPTDSVQYRPWTTFGGGGPKRTRAIGTTIGPGDSVVFVDTIHLNGRGSKEITLAFNILPLCFGPDSGEWSLTTEFWEDRYDNDPYVRLFHTGNSSTRKAEKAMLKLFPNPNSTGVLEIAGLVDGLSKIQIFSSSGKVVHEQIIYNTTKQRAMNLPLHLSSGLYVVRVSGKDGIHSKKYIVN